MSPTQHDQPLNLAVQQEDPRPGGPAPAPPPTEISGDVLNLPNALTVFRIFLVPFLVVVLLTKFEGREYVGLAIFWLASLTDYFDGFLARRQKKVTKLGMLLDPIADKLLRSAAFISLVELGLAPAWMIVVIIGREFAVSGLRSIAAQQGVTIAASPLGKWKMISQVVAISILILGHELGEFIKLGEVALWIVVLFAIGSMVDYFAKFWREVIRGGA
ncbi:MAG TPA: CDP-diacylglycerol--glycerol-3-phosphate 3-phosphatidyltransferase [Thermoanaerobaculia bacterium]